jgi:hypothetical protein
MTIKNRIATIQTKRPKNEENAEYDSRIDAWILVFPKAMQTLSQERVRVQRLYCPKHRK